MSTIAWMHPMLAWIALVAGIIVGIGAWWFVGRYRRYAVVESGYGLQAPSARGFFASRFAVPIFVSLTVLFGMLGRADPQRKVLVPDVQYAGACVGIGVDASFSMLAPERYGSKKTRLERALEEIETLTESFPSGDRLSLMAFAGTPEIFSPRWTNDRRVFFTSLRHINESYVALYGRTGSDIPSAIGNWFKALPEGDSCQVFLVLFTDGEPEGEESALAQQMISSLEIFSQSDRRVITFLVAIGEDREPLRIREYDPAGNFTGFAVKEDGSYIFSRPDIAYLSDIAVRFQGKLIYTEAHGDENLQHKISSSIAEARKIAAMRSKAVYQSIAPWCAAAFLVSLSLLLCALTRIQS
ncbi:MAG: VWA domain-containing protein [bacterium]|nr:VWA domain-containing protein [bacterium]